MSQWLEARDHVVDAPCGHKAHIHGNCPSKKGKGKKMAKMSKAPKEMHAHGSKKGNKKSAKEMRGSKSPKRWRKCRKLQKRCMLTVPKKATKKAPKRCGARNRQKDGENVESSKRDACSRFQKRQQKKRQ